MENRKLVDFLFLILILVIFIGSGFINQTFAYDTETHAYLTSEIFDFYNKNFPQNKLADEFKNYLIDGSRNEDNTPRWMNHFYDPVNNRGLTCDSAIDLICLGNWESSKIWANDNNNQNSLTYKVPATIASTLTAIEQKNLSLISGETDFTWNEAIKDWITGNKGKAIFILGHILHLIEDISVPDHTRNDSHPGDSPYENYSQQFTLANPDQNLNNRMVGKNPIILSDLGNYFDELAKYSNKYFYSKDTIGIQSGYEFPQPDFTKLESGGKYYYVLNRDSDGQNYYLITKKSLGNIIISYPNDYAFDDKISSSYWALLSVKSVQYGAGAINLFFQDVEKAKNDSNFIKADTAENKSTFSAIYDTAKTFANNLGNSLASIWTAAKGVFSTDQNFNQVAEIDLQNNASDSNLTTTQNQNKSRTNAKTVSLKTDSSKTKTDAEVANLKDQINNLKNNIAALEKENQALVKSQSQTTGEISKNTAIGTAGQTNNSSPAQVSCGFNTAQSPSRNKLIINEVAWMGSSASASDEWIELKNISGGDLNISGWQLISQNNQIEINLEGLKNQKIGAGRFILLERTDDNSAIGVPADLIYSGSLANTNTGLRLFDSDCNLTDEVFANPNWPAGDNSSKKTMERDTNGLNWHTSGNVGGTPKQENSSASFAPSGGYTTFSPANTGQNQNNAVQSAAAPQYYPVKITEIMYNPEGSDTDREWIEIYNGGMSAVDLTGWKINEGNANHGLKLSDIKTLNTGEYAVIASNKAGFLSDFPDYSGNIFESAISLNNGGESIALKNGDLKIDEINYSPETGADGNGKSLQLIGGFWKEGTPSPGKENAPDAADKNPTAVFVFSPDNPTAGGEISFDASSSTDSDGNIVEYDWDFGDGIFATTSSNAITHTYANPGDFMISLTVFDDQSVSSSATTSISIRPAEDNNINNSASPANIFISEIVYDGEGDDSGKEFAELYNASDQTDLTGWGLKYKKGDATSAETLAVFGNNSNDITVIPKNGFLLIGLNNYDAANYNQAAADILRSTSLPNGTATETVDVILYDENGNKINSVNYNADSAASGASLERRALVNGECVIAQNENEYSGNGCDSNNVLDKREIPNPQNSKSQSEPRTPPPAPENFTINFEENPMPEGYKLDWKPLDLNLSWGAPQGYENLNYEIKDISDSANHFPDIKAKATSAKIYINEVGRDYKFEISAIDDIGLKSSSTQFSINVPSFFKSVSFYSNSTSSYSLDLSWDKYPFIPDPKAGRKVVIFYYNQDAPAIGDIKWIFGNDYKMWGLIGPAGALSLEYPNCSTLYPTKGKSLILPDSPKYCNVDTDQGKYAINYNLLNNQKISLTVSSNQFNSAPESGKDYVTMAFYSFIPGYEPNDYGTRIVGVDKTKYYFEGIKENLNPL